MASANGSPTYTDRYTVHDQNTQQRLPGNIANRYVPRAQSQFEAVENSTHGQYNNTSRFIGDLNEPGVTNDKWPDATVGKLHQTQNDEISYLRTQVKSIHLLHELLEDNQLENKELHELVKAQAAILKQHGLDVSPGIQARFSRLCLGSFIHESDWSVELKRPPNLLVDGKHQTEDYTLQLKQKDDEIKGLKQELDSCQLVLQSSQDTKSREIARLKQQLQHRAEDCQNSDAICRSLSGETEMLKARLHFLVEECQKLTVQLSEWKTKNDISKTSPPMANTCVSLEDQLQITKRQVQQLDREKGQLAGQLKEVIRMNKRWQKYNVQQEHELVSTKHEMENKNTVCEIQCKDYRETVSRLRKQLQESEERHRHLRINNTMNQDKEDRLRKLQKDIIDLEQKLKASRTPGENIDMAVVEQQLKQYTEDFQREHEEKEKLDKDNTQLKRAYAEATELVEDMRIKLERAERENREIRQRGLRQYANYGFQDRHPLRERNDLIPHGTPPPVISLGEFPTLPRDVQPDGPPPPSFSPPVSPPPTTEAAPAVGEDCVDGGLGSFHEEEPLQCPRCLREFAISKHSDFVRHTEYCLDT